MNTAELELLIYKKRLLYLEKQKSLTPQQIHEVQAMHQIISEGKKYYPSQYKIVDNEKLTERLLNIMQKYNAPTLPAYEEMPHTTPSLNEKEISLLDFCNNLKIPQKTKPDCDAKDTILNLCEYTSWATQEQNAAYVFLLRDEFLPYVIASRTTNLHCYPLLLGRKLLKYFYSHESNNGFDYGECDDDPIYLEFLYTICDTLARHHKSFSAFFKELKPKFLKLIHKNPDFYNFLKYQLDKIPDKKIIVVECGRFGTMPLILKCIDKRVDFRLFATGPEMYSVYKDKLFTKNGLNLAIHELVLLEKSISQNEMFVFSSVKNNELMIKINNNKNILDKCYQEISYSLKAYKKRISKTC